MLNYQSAMLAKTLKGERLFFLNQQSCLQESIALARSIAESQSQRQQENEAHKHHLHAVLKDASAEQARYLFKVCLSDAQQGVHPLPVKETQMLRQLLATERLLAQLIDEATAGSQSAQSQQDPVILSLRGQMLDSSPIPLDHKVCMAASDYFLAKTSATFAQANGGEDALHKDLEHFVTRWTAAHAHQG